MNKIVDIREMQIKDTSAHLRSDTKNKKIKCDTLPWNRNTTVEFDKQQLEDFSRFLDAEGISREFNAAMDSEILSQFLKTRTELMAASKIDNYINNFTDLVEKLRFTKITTPL